MKWNKFIWSAVIWTVFLLWPYLLSRYRPGGPGKFGFFTLFLVAWVIFTVTSVVVLILRRMKHFQQSHSFFYIFLSQANLILAIYGFTQILSATALPNLYGEIILLAANLAMAFLIGWDYFT